MKICFFGNQPSGKEYGQNGTQLPVAGAQTKPEVLNPWQKNARPSKK